MKKNLFKKLISIVLVMVMLVTCMGAYGGEIAYANESTISSIETFIDGEGKINRIEIMVIGVGNVKVIHYIDGKLNNIVEVEIIENGIANVLTTDSVSRCQEQIFVSVSNYIADTENDILPNVQSNSNSSKASYAYAGKIYYNTWLDTWTGNTHDNQLSIYEKEGDTKYNIKTINSEAGAALSFVIGVVGGLLTTIFPGLVALASPLVIAAATTAGTTIVSGIIIGAISEPFWAKTTPVIVKAIDIETNRENEYDAEKYQVALADGSFSSDFEYDGYLPWNTNDVAYWMYCDFWPYDYPGVDRYYVR